LEKILQLDQTYLGIISVKDTMAIRADHNDIFNPSQLSWRKTMKRASVVSFDISLSKAAVNLRKRKTAQLTV